ncbi:hypothetical protein ACWD4G_28600 [Streptomyces sp. NPDC002643]
MTAPHCLVVSLRKSGTHLVSEVMSRFGYSLYGEVSTTADTLATLKGDELWRVLTSVYDEDELSRITTSDDRAAIDAAIGDAVAALHGAWRVRLGIPWRGPREEAPPEDLVARTLTRSAARRFADTPTGVCWFLHQLDPHRVDDAFLQEWLDTGSPRIILNHRDPRDVLLSMVNFLSGGTGRGVGHFSDHRIYQDILRTADSLQDRLTIALTDPCFPGADAFERGLWLLRHPAVCKVTFEELVGPRGGGSREAQYAAVARLAEFVGATGAAGAAGAIGIAGVGGASGVAGATAVDPERIAEEVFNDTAFSFHKGRIGGWREHFTPEHERLFEERYGHVLDAYGHR